MKKDGRKKEQNGKEKEKMDGKRDGHDTIFFIKFCERVYSLVVTRAFNGITLPVVGDVYVDKRVLLMNY